MAQQQESPANAAIGGNKSGLEKADEQEQLQNPAGTGQAKHSQHIDEASRVTQQDDSSVPFAGGDRTAVSQKSGSNDTGLKIEARTDQVPQKVSDSSIRAGGGEAGVQATALKNVKQEHQQPPSTTEGSMHPGPKNTGAAQTAPTATPAGVVLQQNQPAHP